MPLATVSSGRCFCPEARRHFEYRSSALAEPRRVRVGAHRPRSFDRLSSVERHTCSLEEVVDALPALRGRQRGIVRANRRRAALGAAGLPVGVRVHARVLGILWHCHSKALTLQRSPGAGSPAAPAKGWCGWRFPEQTDSLDSDPFSTATRFRPKFSRGREYGGYGRRDRSAPTAMPRGYLRRGCTSAHRRTPAQLSGSKITRHGNAGFHGNVQGMFGCQPPVSDTATARACEGVGRGAGPWCPSSEPGE